MAKKIKKAAKKKKVVIEHWANIYTLDSDPTKILVQGNTFGSEQTAKNNVYPDFTYLKSIVVHKS